MPKKGLSHKVLEYKYFNISVSSRKIPDQLQYFNALPKTTAGS